MLKICLNKKYGINKSLNKSFCKKFGINNKQNLGFLKSKYKYKFNRYVIPYKSDKLLFNFIKENISFLRKIKSYKGIRHKNNYPVRGQRTHTNAKKKFKQTQI